MSENERLAVMRKLSSLKSTGTCPACKSPNGCAMVVGKSVSACWCSGVLISPLKDEYDGCLCKLCLTNKPEETTYV